jgi:hypothetical protein
MKSFKILSVAALLMAFTTVAIGQSKTETFKVSGNCGMCKNKIEKAAKEAGAKEASWDADTKILTVTYKSSSTNTAKIQEKIAAVGYDNAGATASKESYDKLHDCCKYERMSASASSTNEAKDACCQKNGDKMDCCKDAKSMDCCKDGKCTKPGHEGKDCCKKE